MRLPSVLTGQTTSGSSTTEPSVIFQLVASSTASRKKSVKMCRKPSARNSENAFRTRSTSLMTVDNKRPVGWCWKKPMGCRITFA